MLRTLIIVSSLCLATGCGAGGRGALFSANNTRVPPPGTKSYGTADNSYYNSNAPRGLSNNSSPTNGISNAGFVASNGDNNPNGDLNWRAPTTRIPSPILPDLGVMPPPPEMTSRVAPASFAAPVVPPTTPYIMSNENPIRVVDSSSGSVASSTPQLRPTPVNNAMPVNEPAPFRSSVDASEITQLPKVTNVPRIRMANVTAPTGTYSTGNNVPMNAMPIPTFTTPSSSNSTPAASTAPTLNWRTKS